MNYTNYSVWRLLINDYDQLNTIKQLENVNEATVLNHKLRKEHVDLLVPSGDRNKLDFILNKSQIKYKETVANVQELIDEEERVNTREKRSLR